MLHALYWHTKNISPVDGCIHSRCKMKLFQHLLKFLEALGIFIQKSSQDWKQKSRTLFYLLSPIQLIAPTGAFFLFQAKSIREYIQSLNVTIMVSICVVLILISTWKINDILELIEKFEQFIEKRKRTWRTLRNFNSKFNKSNDL